MRVLFENFRKFLKEDDREQERLEKMAQIGDEESQERLRVLRSRSGDDVRLLRKAFPGAKITKEGKNYEILLDGWSYLYLEKSFGGFWDMKLVIERYDGEDEEFFLKSSQDFSEVVVGSMKKLKKYEEIIEQLGKLSSYYKEYVSEHDDEMASRIARFYISTFAELYNGLRG